MWRSSSYVFWPSWNVAVILLIDRILVPFTARGMILEGRRLFTCLPSQLKSYFPAAEMSAPESGSTSTSVEPFRDDNYVDADCGCGVNDGGVPHVGQANPLRSFLRRLHIASPGECARLCGRLWARLLGLDSMAHPGIGSMSMQPNTGYCLQPPWCGFALQPGHVGAVVGTSLS